MREEEEENIPVRDNGRTRSENRARFEKQRWVWVRVEKLQGTRARLKRDGTARELKYTKARKGHACTRDDFRDDYDKRPQNLFGVACGGILPKRLVARADDARGAPPPDLFFFKSVCATRDHAFRCSPWGA